MDKNLENYLFHFIADNDRSANLILDLIKNKENVKEIELSSDIKVTANQIISTFLTALRNQTERLLKSEKPEPEENKNNSPKTEGKLQPAPDKKPKPRVQLFSPAKQEHSSPRYSSSPKSHHVHQSFTVYRSPGSPRFQQNYQGPLLNSPILQQGNDSSTTYSPFSSPSWPTPPPNIKKNLDFYRFEETGFKPRSHHQFSLGDFVINDSKSPKGKTRRIKPTKITPEASAALPTPCPAFSSPVEIMSPKSESDVFSSPLARAGFTSPARDTSSVTSPLYIAPSNMSNHFSSFTITDPDISLLSSTLNTSFENLRTDLSLEKKNPESSITKETIKTIPQACLTLNRAEVTNKNALKRLSNIYSLLLLENLCDNLINELCCLISLLNAVTNKEKLKNFEERKFEHQQSTGEVLIENLLSSRHNVGYFAVETLWGIKDLLLLLTSTTLGLLASSPAVSVFSQDLQLLLNQSSQEKLNKATYSQVTRDENVSFQCNTDNIENFTSHLNFTSFRKQRDGLYQLLVTWESSHSIPGWDFQNKLSSKVRALLAIRDDPTNMLHLARLFKNQLLASCTNHCVSLDEVGEQVLELLPKADRGRLARLQHRLISGDPSKGPVSGVDFSGRQVFFQEFIRACGPGLFLHFLQLTLVDELLRLNDLEFVCEGNDTFIDEMTQKRYEECVSSTRLMAKFLSFCEFLPYHNSQDFSEQVLNVHCSVREKVLPLFDVEKCLVEALTSHRLILTIPWVVLYMALMDRGSARLTLYRRTWRLIAGLGRNLPPISAAGKLMVQLCVGWLFQVASVSEVDEEIIQLSGDSEPKLDELEVVTERVLYLVCPYLIELNTILSASQSSNSSRHIRPTPFAPKTPLTLDSADQAKQLQLRLEESFLQNQSQSTKRAIQFVAERVASCCVKSLAAQKVSLSQPVAPKECWQMCEDRVQQALRALLGRDVADAAVDTAIALTIRQAMEKVEGWIQGHIAAVRNKKENEVETKASVKLIDASPKLNNEKLSADSSALTSCLLQIRQSVFSATEGLLDDFVFRQTLHSVKALHCIPASVSNLMVELLVWSYVCCPNVSTSLWQELLKEIKKLEKTLKASLSRIICPRNLELAKQQDRISRLIQLPTVLVEEGLLSIKDALLQLQICCSYILPEELLKQLQENINGLEKMNLKVS